MLNIVLIVGAVFLFTVWPTKKAAEWVGAGRSGYGSVILVLVLMIVFAVGFALLAIPLAFLGKPGWLMLALVGVAAIGKVYAFALETSFARGLAIALVAGVIGGVLQFAVVRVVGVSMPDAIAQKAPERVTLRTISEAADAFCACSAPDSGCIDHAARRWTQVMNDGTKQDFTDAERRTIARFHRRATHCWEQARQ